MNRHVGYEVTTQIAHHLTGGVDPSVIEAARLADADAIGLAVEDAVFDAVPLAQRVHWTARASA